MSRNAPEQDDRKLLALPRRARLSLRLTQLSLASEALVRAFWPAATLLLSFLALALSGLLERLGGWLHLAVLLLFLAGLGWLAWRGLKGFAWPGQAATVSRAEVASRLPNRPLSGLMDAAVSTPDDPVAAALYRRHRLRLSALLSRLRPAGPRPVLAGLDRYALLPAAGLLFLVALGAAGGDWQNRLKAAFVPGVAAAPAEPVSLEAWLDPPDYTEIAPIYLSQTGGEVVSLPSGSRLIAQVEGLEDAPDLVIDQTRQPFETLSPGLHRLELELTAGSRLAIAEGDRELAAWPIAVTPDAAPTVAFTGDPAESDRKALVVPFRAEDDYGLETVVAELTRLSGDPEELLTYVLAAPEGTSREVAGENYQDLTAHPWAGLEVALTLVATDGRGQEGRSEIRTFVLPQRIFTHPVAQKLVELRRQLTVAPTVRKPVVRALDRLVDAADDYGNDLVAALGMIDAASRLERDRSPDAVPAVQGLLWETALRIEEGDVSLMVQELRDIQKRLQDALDRGASEEEIEALLDELEQAMQRYLQAMQEEMRRRMERGELPQTLPENSQMIPQQSLEQMMQELRELNRAGARDLARQRLEQLQRLLENLEAMPFAMPDPSATETLEQMRQLEGMLRRQQELLDQSHRANQGQRQPGDKPLSGNAEEQERLRRELGQMMRDLAQQLGEVPQNLGRAEQAMRRAEEALQGEDAESAVGAQSEAVDQMRQSLSDLAQRMTPQLGPPRDGQGSAPLGSRRDMNQDPLGREAGQGRIDTREDIGIPDAGELTRAREILDELRQRRDDPTRPTQEHQYIERLLDFF